MKSQAFFSVFCAATLFAGMAFADATQEVVAAEATEQVAMNDEEAALLLKKHAEQASYEQTASN